MTDGSQALAALRALSGPQRLSIVQALRERERCVRDLVGAVGMSQPLTSHHLGILAEAGLVTTRQADGFTYYAIDPDGVSQARAFLDGLLDVATLPAAAHPGGGSGCCQ